MISCQGRKPFPNSRWLQGCLVAVLLVLAPAARADSLDRVLDALTTAGVLDPNLKSAKPLIFCLAHGGSVQDCSLGDAARAEMASNPQVQNAAEVFHAYEDHDWPGLVEKAGVAVGCALIPGGGAKDLLCGEIGKFALAAVEGVVSLLGDVGGAVAGFFGIGGDDGPTPMSPEDYYVLYEQPAYHRLVMALDARDGSAEKLAHALYLNCRAYYGGFEHYATNSCESDELRVLTAAGDLRRSLLAEGESWLQMHAVPKLHDWARANFGGDSSAFVVNELQQCQQDLREDIPLPEPGFQRCELMKSKYRQFPMITEELVAKLDAPCQAEAQSMVVLPPNDGYRMACDVVARKLPVRVIGEMGVWRQRMNLAQGLGCGNDGTPNSVHCDSYASQAACMKAMPEAASFCQFDKGKADVEFAQQVFAELYRQSASAGKPQRCLRTGSEVLCFRPVKRQGCKTYALLKGDAFGLARRGDDICKLQSDPQYDALKARAGQILARLNGQAATALAPRPRLATDDSAPLQVPHTLRSGGIAASAALAPEGPCRLSYDDPLRIHCESGFRWDADAARAKTVRQINGGDFGICGPDLETDGADLPCLDGVAVGAFPSGSSTPAPPPVRIRPRVVVPRPANGG